MTNKRTPPAAKPGASKPSSVTADRRAAQAASAARPPRRPAPAPEAQPEVLVDPAAKRSARGAAPWATRHAAKRAAEEAKRRDEPVRPGSARSTLRTPDNADDIKSQILHLHNMLNQLNVMRKTLSESFYEAGLLLAEIRDKKLYLPKGYATFEAFVERETAIGKSTALSLADIPEIFTREAAKGAGLDSTIAALATFRQAHSPRQVRARPSRPPVARVIVRE
jgi:hypothetical protein